MGLKNVDIDRQKTPSPVKGKGKLDHFRSHNSAVLFRLRSQNDRLLTEDLAQMNTNNNKGSPPV